MHLITMAHAGEAQGVIAKFQLISQTKDLFVNQNLALLITGEGPFEAAVKTALVLKELNVTQITNLGIAGTLDPKFKVGEILEVRSLYLIQDLRPQFKTFQVSSTGVDCLTSFERILNPDKAKTLKGVGALVDREAWGVAYAAKAQGVSFKSYKLVSDLAGTLDACEVIKEKAQEYSDMMAGYLSLMLNKEVPEEVSKLTPAGFHFTFSTEHQFHSYLSKLAIKNNTTQEEALKELPIKDLQELKLLPKERTKKLLDILLDKIDPTKKKLDTQKANWVKTFEAQGLKVQTDPKWEETSVTVSFEVKTDEELHLKASSLEKLSLKPFLNLMNGELDVE